MTLSAHELAEIAAGQGVMTLNGVMVKVSFSFGYITISWVKERIIGGSIAMDDTLLWDLSQTGIVQAAMDAYRSGRLGPVFSQQDGASQVQALCAQMYDKIAACP